MARELTTPWSSDTTPSLPVPTEVARLVPMGGFCFTVNGLAHDLGRTEVEALSIPNYAPARRVKA